MHKSTLKTIGTLLVLLACAAAIGALFNLPPLADGAGLGGTALAMAVVAKYGTGARDPSLNVAIDGIKAAAEYRVINSVITFAVGDSTSSTHVIGELPADAILDPTSRYDYGATGITDLDIGFAYPNGGTLIDIDNLVDGDDVSTAGNQTLIGHGTLTAANSQKRVWELAGLTTNPGGNLALIATQKAGTAAAASIYFSIGYSKGA
jgi:hypothetical protein